MRRKIVYVNGAEIGLAATWGEVAELLEEKGASLEAARERFEGRDGFYVALRRRSGMALATPGDEP